MVQTGSIILVFTAVLSGLFRAFVKPRIDELGLFRKVPNFNSQHCTPITGLEACEDIYLHRPSALAYLACSRPADRAHWLPALSLLNRDRMPRPSLDHLALLDLNTHAHRPLTLLNLPPHIQANGLHTHGLDLYIHQPDSSEPPLEQLPLSSSPSVSDQRATIYVINHNPPEVFSDASIVGADSVIEVFDTLIGSDQAVYRTTIRHPLILTPNNIVATGHNSFYVSNDHKLKTGWRRKLAPFLLDHDMNSIIHCTFTDHHQDSLESNTNNCIVAAEGHSHPNGLAKGPESSIYLVTTYNPHLYVYETQADHSLVLTDELKLPRMADNIYVTESGSIYLAMIPKALTFFKSINQNLNNKHEIRSPTEVWRISNGTGPDAFFGGRLAVEKILGDDGQMVSGTTAIGVHGTKIFLTGISSPYVSVCEMGEEKWTT